MLEQLPVELLQEIMSVLIEWCPIHAALISQRATKTTSTFNFQSRRSTSSSVLQYVVQRGPASITDDWRRNPAVPTPVAGMQWLRRFLGAPTMRSQPTLVSFGDVSALLLICSATRTALHGSESLDRLRRRLEEHAMVEALLVNAPIHNAVRLNMMPHSMQPRRLRLNGPVPFFHRSAHFPVPNLPTAVALKRRPRTRREVTTLARWLAAATADVPANQPLVVVALILMPEAEPAAPTHDAAANERVRRPPLHVELAECFAELCEGEQQPRVTLSPRDVIHVTHGEPIEPWGRTSVGAHPSVGGMSFEECMESMAFC
jgi:hypothetical protein